MKAFDYKSNCEPISERDLVPVDPDYSDTELDDPSTSELLRQLEVEVPIVNDDEAAIACDNLHLSQTIAIRYRGKTYFVDPTDFEDIFYFITSVLDCFFGFHGSQDEKEEFNKVVKDLLKVVPDSLFNDSDNRLLKLLVPLPKEAVLLEFCERVHTWTEERYRLLLYCAKSVCRLPKKFLSKHAMLNTFRKVVYDTETTYGDCRQSGWAYSQVKSYLDSCVKKI